MTADTLAAYIRTKAGHAPVKMGIVLGSGLSHLADAVDGITIPYAELGGFPHAGVSGHAPKLVIGDLEGVRVAVFAGRAHYYEDGNAAVMRRPLEVLKALGADMLILTNAAGSLRDDIPPGELMLLSDHIAFCSANPLVGEHSDARFVPMDGAHDPAIRAALRDAATRAGVTLKEGVYGWFSGPSFETPAEIRMAKICGADAVGMSTVPEVILARFLGLRVAAISTMTNMGAGLSDEALSHEQTKAVAPLGAVKIEATLREWLRTL